MNLKTFHSFTFAPEDTVVSAALSAPHEAVIMLSSGLVFRFDMKAEKSEPLFSVKSNTGYQDGGFDTNAQTSIHTLDSIVVVANDYKRHAYVHYPGNYRRLHLHREDYYANTSRYPIALFKNEQGIPHLIYSQAWNHLQIMNLDSRQILTADKSLIEEGAEERHLEFYQKYPEDNKLPWPRPYDYFFGGLQMSPDQKSSLSAGWVWGSFDACNVYEVAHFLTQNRIADIYVAGGEHLNRPICWINPETIALASYPFEDDGKPATRETPHEIHFYKIEGSTSTLQKKITLWDMSLINTRFSFNQKLQALIISSEEAGMKVLSLEGEVLFSATDMPASTYYPNFDLFLTLEGNVIKVQQLVG